MYAVGLKRNCAWLLAAGTSAAGTCADVDASTDVDATPYVDPRAKTHQYSHSSTSNPYPRATHPYPRTAHPYPRATHPDLGTTDRYAYYCAADSYSLTDILGGEGQTFSSPHRDRSGDRVGFHI